MPRGSYSLQTCHKPFGKGLRPFPHLVNAQINLVLYAGLPSANMPTMLTSLTERTQVSRRAFALSILWLQQRQIKEIGEVTPLVTTSAATLDEGHPMMKGNRPVEGLKRRANERWHEDFRSLPSPDQHLLGRNCKYLLQIILMKQGLPQSDLRDPG